MIEFRKISFLILVLVCISSAVFSEPIAVIVNKNNEISEISAKDLDFFFSKKKHTWPGGKKAIPIHREFGSDERDIFNRIVHGKSSNKIKRYWLDMQVKGVRPPMTQPSDSSVKAMVVRIPGAIGYINLSKVDDTVKIINVDGVGPSDVNYLIKE